jgi:hypothetical protein
MNRNVKVIHLFFSVPVDSKGTWIGILSGAVVMLLAAVIGVFIYYRKREAYTEENAVITPGQYFTCTYYFAIVLHSIIYIYFQ